MGKDKYEIIQDRNNLVVKSNELIRNTRYSLTEKEQKIVIYLMSLIARDDDSLNEIKLSISEFCHIVGINNSGNNYIKVKNAIQGIADKSWWINTDKKDILFRWIDTAIIEKNSGIITVKLSQSLKPYLIQLKEDFTKYELINVLMLRGKYTIRLYELLKSYLWLGEWTIELDKLKEIIQCFKYEEYKEFNRNVISYAIKEINDCTDLQISYETKRKGRRVEKIKFKINEKSGIQLTFDLIDKITERLG